MARRTCADGPQRILHCVIQLHLFAIVEEASRILHDLRVQRVIHRIARAVAVIGDLVCTIDRDQQRVQVQIIQMRRATRHLRQQISAPDHLVQGPRADAGEDLAHFGCIEGDQVDDLIRRAGELLAQVFVLGANANRASVRLALTHHDTAHRNQRGGADAVFFGTHHRSHDNVTTRAQTTIRAQRDPLAQVVHRQHLMRLGQTHFPWQTRIFDRRRWRRARAAIVTRNQDHIGLGLGHASGNRADAG